MLINGLKDGKNQSLEEIEHDIPKDRQMVKILNYHLDLNWGRCRQVLGCLKRHGNNYDDGGDVNHHDALDRGRPMSLSLWPYILWRANIGGGDTDDSSSIVDGTALSRRPMAADVIKYFIQNGSSSFGMYREPTPKTSKTRQILLYP